MTPQYVQMILFKGSNHPLNITQGWSLPFNKFWNQWQFGSRLLSSDFGTEFHLVNTFVACESQRVSGVRDTTQKEQYNSSETVQEWACMLHPHMCKHTHTHLHTSFFVRTWAWHITQPVTRIIWTKSNPNLSLILTSLLLKPSLNFQNSPLKVVRTR